jgi:hypothetical protein
MAVAGILRLRENLDAPDAAILHGLAWLSLAALDYEGWTT